MVDKGYMKRAIALAKRGAGWVSPNPMVGAVIVKNGRTIGEGYHRRYGENHAEINAIENASRPIEGSTFYVTLEPCTHYGKTPPCVDRIVALKPARVVVGSVDPNPVVSGRGIKIMRDHGIKTTTGVLQDECVRLNERYFKYTMTGIPFVTVKYAQTFDGRIASATGHSRWISSDASLTYAHRLRSFHDAVMVGIGTVLADDPDLTVRLVRGKQPLRVVIDPHLKIPSDSCILRNQETSRTLVICGTHYDRGTRSLLTDGGIETVVIPEGDDGRISVTECLTMLGERGISSLLVEGGAGTITAFIKERLVDRLIAITAPKILGRGVEAVGNLDILKVDDSIGLDIERIRRKGPDIIIEARLRQ